MEPTIRVAVKQCWTSASGRASRGMPRTDDLSRASPATSVLFMLDYAMEAS